MSGSRDGRLDLVVPTGGELAQIGRSDRAAAAGRAAITDQRVVEVAFAVVTGQLLTGLDLANCDLRLESERARVGFAVMVDVTSGIPTQNLPVEMIDVCVAIDVGPIVLAKRVNFGAGQNLVEAATNPGQGAFGDQAGGSNAVTDRGADPAELGVRVYHRLEFQSRVSNPEIRVRAWREEDIPAVIEVQRAAYPDFPDDEQYGRRKFGLALATFPEGQLLAEVGQSSKRQSKIVGYATSLILQLYDDVPYTYDEITGHGTFSSHTPTGDTLYGADIAVDPDYQGMGVAQALWAGRRELMRRYNLRRMIAYGRLPGYPAYAGRLTAREYVDAVVAGELQDQALTAHTRAGYRVTDVRLDLMADPSSLDWATILEFENPEFSPERRHIAGAPLRRAARRMRVCAAQYMMRTLRSWAQFRRSVEFFIDAADDYHCHLLVFPELFTLQLLTTMPGLSDRSAIARLSGMVDQYRGMFKELAQERGLYIVGGSTPLERDGQRYNVAHLFTPSGAIYTQDKLQITPYERERWGIRPGFGLNVFDTPLGRLAIQVCYDIEFPEPSRLLTFAGAEVLVVPFATDERRAYIRVRHCAHARAIENNVYVVLAGNAGNLPARGNLLNYARSTVLTPSDFGFPPEGVAAEADPNVETVAIADLDFSILAQLREMGSVRPLHDRRGDVYKLASDPPPKVHTVI